MDLYAFYEKFSTAFNAVVLASVVVGTVMTVAAFRKKSMHIEYVSYAGAAIFLMGVVLLAAVAGFNRYSLGPQLLFLFVAYRLIARSPRLHNK